MTRVTISGAATGLGQPEWFAVQVKSRWEQSTEGLLHGKGYETLLPMYKTERRSGARMRMFDAPLFPGYVFCQFDVHKRLPILVTPGVIAVVSRGRIPIAVDSAEIATIQRLVSSGAAAEPWPYVEIGERVRIEDTALNGVEGVLLAVKGRRRVIISVSLLRRSVALEINRASITPVCEKRSTGVAQPESPVEEVPA